MTSNQHPSFNHICKDPFFQVRLHSQVPGVTMWISLFEPQFSPLQGMECLSVLMPQEKGGLWQGETQTGNESGE